MFLRSLLAFVLLIAAMPAFAASDILDRVKKSGEIRCGYAVWQPMLYKDTKANVLTGALYDLTEELGRRLDLKIVWAEETGWGTIVEGLSTRRYDMICTGLAASSARAKFIDFSIPYFYAPLQVIVRADDKRFDQSYDVLNDEFYTIAVLEGEMSAITARQRFPKAKTAALPQMMDYSMLLKEVESGKADITLIEPSTFADYDKTNPGKLKIVDPKRPINVFPGGFGLPQDEYAFKRMIDVALHEMLLDGTVDRLIKKYEPREGIFLPVTKPYGSPQ